MDSLTLFLYGILNLAMVIFYLIKKGDLFKAPFWIGIISLGWFLPQAIGGLNKASFYPDSAYSEGMLFAFFCNLSFWLGWLVTYSRKESSEKSLIMMRFDDKKLFSALSFLCVFGFYFQWKLWSLPDEMLIGVAWSGTVVKYWFLSGVFKFGFIGIWILYLKSSNISKKKLLIFLIPCFYLMLEAALFRGRRAEMMNLVSYTFVALWLVRSYIPPRMVMIFGLIIGLIFINAIGTYRSIMYKSDLPLNQRIDNAINANYLSKSKDSIEKSSYEFENYIYQRKAVSARSEYDYGLYHWNQFIYNYIPAQLVGSEFKESLVMPLTDLRDLARDTYGHHWHTGMTSTGYSDSFSSFSWLGAVKFLIAGFIMGYLYKNAQSHSFLAKLLYIYLLNYAMHMVTHNTNDFLIRQWVYFIVLVFPFLYFSQSIKIRWR